MKREEIQFVVGSFLVWRLALFIVLLVAAHFVPLQKNFLGGGLANYLSAPWFWAWANFDGEHYLSIAQHGYGHGEQAFFPLYPLVIRSMGTIFGGSLGSFNLAGLLISNLSFLGGLIGLYKLVKLDYLEKVAKLTVVILLLFPTSFYFGAVYTESLFLCLIVWSFYLARKGKWLFASILGGFASATRVMGIILLPVLFMEWYQGKRRIPKNLLSFLPLLIIPLGLIGYMYYLRQTIGDWLAFLHSLPGFGEQRSATPIFLPQVFYRYFFKILPSLNYSYFPIVFTTLFELGVGLVFLILSFVSFLRLRLNYSVFLFLGYLLPTLSGSFSSLPRYVLVLFPAFILISFYLNKLPKYLMAILLAISALLLTVAGSLFFRGYWVS